MDKRGKLRLINLGVGALDCADCYAESMRLRLAADGYLEVYCLDCERSWAIPDPPPISS